LTPKLPTWMTMNRWNCSSTKTGGRSIRGLIHSTNLTCSKCWQVCMMGTRGHGGLLEQIMIHSLSFLKQLLILAC
jgi:hypothetical protein